MIFPRFNINIEKTIMMIIIQEEAAINTISHSNKKE